MTLRHLKIFVSVCKYGSTVKASKKLFIAQPTVSLTITELEKFYDVTLFERRNQRLILTDIGQELLVKAKDILSGFDEFESLATFSGKSPKVRIGATLTLGQTLIPKFLQLVKKENLPIRPQILIRQASTLEQQLEQGNLDFAVIGGDIISPNLKATQLSHERFIAVANSNYDVPSRLTLKEFVSYPLLLREFGSSSRDFLEGIVASKGLKASPMMDSSNNQALVTALDACLGIAYLTDSYVLDRIAKKEFKEILIEDLTASRTNSLVIHKNKRLNTLQQQSFDLIKNGNLV